MVCQFGVKLEIRNRTFFNSTAIPKAFKQGFVCSNNDRGTAAPCLPRVQQQQAEVFAASAGYVDDINQGLPAKGLVSEYLDI